ncbi:unnamed protein product [Soboliphyme baturini]|uniref:Zinc finger, RING/FYVE/PHD-type n=1 Tax=Soboliphyme baturini TaxID=241478 RepID=A0A183INL5_9BILA|nr:unnamed protein product [Soboliphyme baturini]
MSDTVTDETTIIFQTDDGQVLDARELATAFSQAEEGAAQVVDGEGNVITITAEQLAEAGIDMANLGADQVDLILHLAQASQKAMLLSSSDAVQDDEDKRRQSLDLASSDYSQAEKSGKYMSQQHHRGFVGGSSGSEELERYHESNGSASFSNRGEMETRSERTPSGFALIGSQIEVRRGNKTYTGTVRFVRRGVGYKVEFEGGRFEWVTEDQIGFKQNDVPGTVNAAEDVQKKRDHEYLTGSMDASPARCSSGFQSCRPVGASGIASAGGSPYVTDRHFPGKESHDAGDVDFSCPICNQKVYNKEPSYIVIRIPACQRCAESKILVLDDN